MMQTITRFLFTRRLHFKGRSYSGRNDKTEATQSTITTHVGSPDISPTTPISYYIPGNEALIMSGALKASKFLGCTSGVIVYSGSYMKYEDELGASVCGALATMVAGSLPLFYGARIAIVPGYAVSLLIIGYFYEYNKASHCKEYQFND